MLQLDGLDYDARLAAYKSPISENLTAFIGSRASVVFLYTAFLDIQSVDDLALRYAAAQALSNFVITGTENDVHSSELFGLSTDIREDRSKTNLRNTAFKNKTTNLSDCCLSLDREECGSFQSCSQTGEVNLCNLPSWMLQISFASQTSCKDAPRFQATWNQYFGKSEEEWIFHKPACQILGCGRCWSRNHLQHFMLWKSLRIPSHRKKASWPTNQPTNLSPHLS